MGHLEAGAAHTVRLAVAGLWAPLGAPEFSENPGFGQIFRAPDHGLARTGMIRPPRALFALQGRRSTQIFSSRGAPSPEISRFEIFAPCARNTWGGN